MLVLIVFGTENVYIEYCVFEKLYAESTEYGVNELNTAIMYDIINKPPPSLISPLLKCPKLSKPPGGLIEPLWYGNSKPKISKEIMNCEEPIDYR